MMVKETVTAEDLLTVLELLDGLKMRYWVDGGWGIAILCGKQYREHRDIDEVVPYRLPTAGERRNRHAAFQRNNRRKVRI